MGWPLLLVLSLATLARGQSETCLTVDQDPYLLFGTKTAYIFSNKDFPNKRTHDVPGCLPMAIWMLNRHGSHNPEADEVESLKKLADLRNNIINNYRTGNIRNFNERLCSADLSLLERWSWSPPLNMSYAGDLTSDGYMTTQNLAQAWRQKYPGLLTENPHDYLFKFVHEQRSITTFKAFTEGLFKAQAEQLDIPKAYDEKFLRPYKSCPSWTRDIEQKNETLSQLHIFESKREYQEMISNISHRLGFSWDVHKDIIHQIYQMCRYNKAWDVSNISPWCAAFTKEDLKRLEYGEDLATYYKYGYGSDMNAKIGCSYVKDMMSFFKNHVEREPPQQPRTMVLFAEAPTILMTHTAMGTHRDSAPLTGDNYHSNTVQNRKWSSSNMSPFNANLAAVLYKCTPNGNFQVNDQYQVLFLENERTMSIEGCRVGLCDWSYVKNKFGETADLCNLEFCNGAGNINGFVGLSVAVFAFFARFFVL